MTDCSVQNKHATRRRGNPMSGNTLILGLGNILLGDDGVGVHAIAHLQDKVAALPDVTLLDGGTLSFTLAADIEAARDLVVIDAAQLKREPGTVQVFEGTCMDQFVMNCRKSSVHEVSLVDLLAMATLCGHLPSRRALIGIQPACIEWSESLTDAVQRAVAVACDAALEVAARWRSEVSDSET